MSKVFENYQAKKKFIELLEALPEPARSDFGEAIRKRADEKVTDLESTEGFYLTEDDVVEIYETLENKDF